jgi:hypothetical protein
MDRSELIERYKAVVQTFELPADQVVMSAGGACVLHRLREETSDLDIHLPRSMYTRVRTRALAQGKVITKPVRPGQPTEMVQYHPWLSIAPLDYSFTSEEVEGVWVYDCRSLLIQKLQLNRAKDQEDIMALMFKYAKDQS